MRHIRKTLCWREVVHADAQGHPCAPVSRAVAMAVLANPLSGKDREDLSILFNLGGEVGELLAGEALALLSKDAVSYGKAAIVGTAGDMEHGAAMIHPRLGKAMRTPIGGGKALIPSNAKVAAAGACIDVPLGHKDDAWSFDHFDTITVAVPDAPRPQEIVLIVAFADGGRPWPRCGTGPIT